MLRILSIIFMRFLTNKTCWIKSNLGSMKEFLFCVTEEQSPCNVNAFQWCSKILSVKKYKRYYIILENRYIFLRHRVLN